jgi:creatinine amidohydrolase/Fe(II)-dependent formamide hydrolase-like protein
MHSTHLQKTPRLFGAILLTALTLSAADPIDFEKMTWQELKRAIHEQGKTTVLVFNGGTEQRGPQNASGGHTLIAHGAALRIAEKLGNAIVAPVLPFSVNNASAELPGTIGLTGPLFAAVNEHVTEQLIKNGFKNVVLLGDHGGGQKELAETAKKLDEKYAPQGIRVVYCDAVYQKANTDFDKWLTENGYPVSSHAGIEDTSEMLYLGGNDGWVRKELIATAVGTPRPKPGEPRDPDAPRVSNGISGDARRSTPELGKRFLDLKVEYATKQIQELLSAPAASK